MVPLTARLIAFDLDDTLWPCMPTIIKAEEELYQWLSNHYPLMTHRYSMTSMMGQRVNFALKHPEWAVDLSTMRKQFLTHLAQTCHYPVNEVKKISEEGFKVFFKWRNTVTYFSDVIPSLKRLSETYILATISNGNADVMQTEAAPYISYAINAGDVKIAKPESKMFEVIAKRANVSASQCVYCGDDIAIDMVGSRKAGWHPIWVNRGQKNWPTKYAEQPQIITSLEAL